MTPVSEGAVRLSVVVPCYNEARNIKDCLASLAENEIDFSQVEFLIVDGGSVDDTRDLAMSMREHGLQIRCIDNPQRIKPVALNLGIAESSGEYVMRIDAHCTYAPGYIDRIVAELELGHADNVGGVQLARTIDDGSIPLAIAIAVSHPIGMGNALHRMDVLREPTFVDTVFCGCYRRKVFDEIGHFNEALIRTQDREFNQRLLDAGGKILLLPDVHAFYRPRTKLIDHIRWVFNGSLWLSMSPRFTQVKMTRLRNYVPAAFVAYVVAAFGSSTLTLPRSLVAMIWFPAIVYLLIVFGEAIRQAFVRKTVSLVWAFPLVILTTHFGYGFGTIVGAVRRYV